MKHISGLPDPQVAAWEDVAEMAMRVAMQAVMDQIADRIGKIQVTPRTRVLVSAAGDEVPSPAPDDLPPGQPYVSADDLASITPLWQQQVAENLLPIAAQVFQTSANAVHASLVTATGVAPGAIAPVGSLAAETYLARAANTFEEVSDTLWTNARAQLLEGFEQGESIPQLAERLRGSAEVSARTGVLVARTQVIEASNAGSYAMAQVSGLAMKKEWIETIDLRTRPTHLEAGAKYQAAPIPLAQPFIVGGYPAMFPAVYSLPPAERYSCRCAIGYVMSDSVARRADVELAPDPMADLPGTSGPSIDEIAAAQTAEVNRIIAEQHAAAEALVKDVHDRFDQRFGSGRRPQAAIPAPVAQTAIRAPLTAAQTVRQVDDAAMAEARRLTGRDIRFDQSGSDLAIAREHAEGILRGLERYPDSPLSQIGTFGPGGSVPGFDEPRAFTATLPRNDVVLFNVRMARDPQAYHAALRRGVDNDWHAPGTATPIGQALHEFGHTVDETFTQAGAKLAAVRDELAEPLTGKAYREAVAGGVSRYAAKSSHELGAEAFADVMVNGDAASPISRAVFGAIDRGYRTRGSSVGFERRAEGGARDITAVTRERGPDQLYSDDGVGVYPVGLRLPLKRARTVSDVEDVYRAEARKLNGRFNSIDLAGSDLEIAKLHAEGALRVLREFPELDVALMAEDLGGSTYASTAVNLGHVRFSSQFSAHPDIYFDGLTRDRMNGYHLRGVANPAGISAHEVGHVVHFQYNPAAMRESVSRLLDALSERAGMSVEDYVRFQTGRYALKHIDELIAEGIGDAVISGPVASELSKEILSMMRQAYAHGPMRPTGADLIGLVKNAEVDLDGLTVAQLRALAKTRGLTIRAGTRKPDIIQAIREGPPEGVAAVQVVPRSAASFTRLRNPETKARARQVEIDKAVPFGDFAVRIDELVANGASGRALLHSVDTMAERSGLSTADATRLRELADDPAALRQASREIAGREGVELVGQAGDVVRFDPATMESIGAAIEPGTAVTLVRPATRLHLGKEVIPAKRAAVQVGGDLPTGARAVEAVSTQSRFDAAIVQARSGERAFDSVPLSSGTSDEVKRLIPGDEGGRVYLSIRRYGADQRDIAAALRGGRELDSATLKRAREDIANIDQAMALSPVRDDIVLWRGLEDGPATFGARFSGDLTGVDLTDLSFASASANERIANGFAGSGADGVLMRVLTPRGTEAVQLSSASWESEILLQRGLTYRVVADHGVRLGKWNKSYRQLDVEIVPKGAPAVAAPTGQISAEVSEAGRVALERKALREAARERNRLIESGNGTARLLAEVDKLVAEKASKATIAQRLDPVLIGREQIFAGADPAVLDLLTKGLATGDPVKLRSALTRAGTKAKIKPISKVGAKAKFDQATMEGVGGIDIADGAQVIVVRRGSTLTLPDGTTMQLERAQVTPVPKPSAKPSVGQPSIKTFMDEAPTREDFYAMETLQERWDLITEQGKRFARGIDGEYAGLRVEVKRTDAFSRDFILLNGKITDPATGKVVGKFTRTLMRNADTGEITAGHALLQLQGAYRGSGFAEQFNQNLYDWYRRSGVTKVDVHANIDIGAYTWAAKGFDFASPALAERLISKARTRITQALARKAPPKGITREQLEELSAYVRQIERGDIPARAFDLSQFGRREGQGGKAAVWPGKWLLLDKGMDWHGVMYL